MNFVHTLQEQAVKAVKALYNVDFDPNKLIINPTRKDIEGDFTLVVFPFTKIAKKGPEQVANELGTHLAEALTEVESFNVVKGFLNFTLTNHYWMYFLTEVNQNENFGKGSAKNKKVLVEYSSPNTNKPLHLGHIRNILLGWSVSQVLEAAGYEVIKAQIINDRGIHICKSMIAWQKFGNGETPTTSGMKGDHLIGKYYVKYASEEKAQKAELVAAGTPDEEPAILQEARAMLVQWENNDPEVIELWKTMNGWVYQGFEETYKSLGVYFDKYYYESNTYILGNDIVDEGLNKGLFYEKADGSVWIDLEDAKLDHKLVRRSDGTSVYITQDLGTAQLRFKDFGTEKMVYVVGDEQEYHFKVLFEILKRMGESYADGLYHLSYGMVNLPSGRMKSREGTVVDADDLMREVIFEAQQQSLERATLDGVEDAQKQTIWRMIGMAALKYYILNVSQKKSMVYNPTESL
ncbi:MAG: arginine--tRNA ligase, partial [Bacteroidota bacterium]